MNQMHDQKATGPSLRDIVRGTVPAEATERRRALAELLSSREAPDDIAQVLIDLLESGDQEPGRVRIIRGLQRLGRADTQQVRRLVQDPDAPPAEALAAARALVANGAADLLALQELRVRLQQSARVVPSPSVEALDRMIEQVRSGTALRRPDDPTLFA